MTDPSAPAADWYPDPSGRFQFRYWDGQTWTGHVSTDGATDWDPPEEQGQAATAAQEEGGDPAAAAASAGVTSEAGTASGVDLDTQQVSPEQQAEALAAAEVELAEPQPAQPEPAREEAEPAVAPPEEIQPAMGEAQPTPPADPVAPGPAAQEDEHARWADRGAGTVAAAETGPAAVSEPAAEPVDNNLVAIDTTPVAPDVADWLRAVAAQVEPRLTRIAPQWTMAPQAEAAKACAFGLLLGHLATRHDHMRQELSAVAESHPSFTTLDAGSRLETLQQIAGEPARAAAWLGPLIGVEDPAAVQRLFD